VLWILYQLLAYYERAGDINSLLMNLFSRRRWDCIIKSIWNKLGCERTHVRSILMHEAKRSILNLFRAISSPSTKELHDLAVMSTISGFYWSFMSVALPRTRPIKISCSKGATTLSITTLSIMEDHCYAECHLRWMSLMLNVTLPTVTMLSVTYKPFMLSVIMLNVVMLSAIMLNVVAPFKKPLDLIYGILQGRAN
jgi:hypothetical protein